MSSAPGAVHPGMAPKTVAGHADRRSISVVEIVEAGKEHQNSNRSRSSSHE
jgi:hypothetical protein